jgi:hypothetical protein
MVLEIYKNGLDKAKTRQAEALARTTTRKLESIAAGKAPQKLEALK